MAKKEEKKEKAAVVIIPIVIFGGLIAWLLRKKAPSPPPPPIYFEKITDPRITLYRERFTWGFGTLPVDLIASAELTVDFRVAHTDFPPYQCGGTPILETYLYEFLLVEGETATTIGTSTTVLGGYTSISYVESFPVVLSLPPGSYYTMIRIYRDGTLVAQYPYLSMIEVLPRTVSTFIYEKPILRIYWDGEASDYFAETTCRITNRGPSPQTRKVAVWSFVRYDELDETPCNYHQQIEREWQCLRGQTGGEVDVTLAPGASIDLTYEGPGRFSGSELCAVQFRDDGGGVSPSSDLILIDF